MKCEICDKELSWLTSAQIIIHRANGDIPYTIYLCRECCEHNYSRPWERKDKK